MKQYESSQGLTDPLEVFKRQLEARCERSFQDLRKKNDITKTLINNLSDGIDRQQQRIEMLGSNIRNLQGSVHQQNNIIDVTNQQQMQLQRQVATVIGEKDRQIAEVVQQIIARLQGFQETIKGLPKPERPNQQRMNNLESSLAELDNQIQILSQRNGPQEINYETEREHLYRDMNFLEQILEEEKNQFNETNRLLQKNLEVYKATIEQPINNFDVNLSRQNQQNEKILKSKLHGFAGRIKKLQANLQKIAQQVKERRKAIAEGERKLEEGLASLGQGIMQANSNLAGIDKDRMQKIQENGNFLDTFVDNMLLQTAELNKRIDNLKAAYETQINKLKSDFNSRSQEVEMVRRKN